MSNIKTQALNHSKQCGIRRNAPRSMGNAKKTQMILMAWVSKFPGKAKFCLLGNSEMEILVARERWYSKLVSQVMATHLGNGRTINYTDRGSEYTKMGENTRVTIKRETCTEKAPLRSAMEQLILETLSWTILMDMVSQITLKNQPVYHAVNDLSRLSIDHS